MVVLPIILLVQFIWLILSLLDQCVQEKVLILLYLKVRSLPPLVLRVIKGILIESVQEVSWVL